MPHIGKDRLLGSRPYAGTVDVTPVLLWAAEAPIVEP
jgi:hypothetical protein